MILVILKPTGVAMQTKYSLKPGEFNPAFLRHLEKIVAGNAVDITLNIKTLSKRAQDVPNADTIAAMAESKRILAENEKGTTDVKNLFARLDSMEI